MGRRVKRHVQQQLRWSNAAGDLRGRKREAADRRGKKRIGRPKKPNAGVPHGSREAFRPTEPVHVTLRATRAIGRLRTRGAYKAIRQATITVLGREDFRIVHLSIQGTHIHLLVEAEGRRALAKGMQAFGISAAKHLNAAVSRAGGWWERAKRRRTLLRSSKLASGGAPKSDGALASRGGLASIVALAVGGETGGLPERRRGRVFADRYHATVIRTPKHARHELAYVLNNWRKHREDREGVARRWTIDPFSTGWLFQGWRERADEPFAWKLRETYEPMPVWWPRTWLLSEGWRRYGLIGTHEVPGARFVDRGAGRPVRRARSGVRGVEALCVSVADRARARG